MPNKTFIHRALIRGKGPIPNTLFTIWYYPWFKAFHNAYDFEIRRVTIHELKEDGVVGETIIDQEGFDEIDDMVLESTFEQLIKDGIIEEHIGNHYRFSLNEKLL